MCIWTHPNGEHVKQLQHRILKYTNSHIHNGILFIIQTSDAIKYFFTFTFLAQPSLFLSSSKYNYVSRLLIIAAVVACYIAGFILPTEVHLKKKQRRYEHE